jgi:hypothetical protein
MIISSSCKVPIAFKCDEKREMEEVVRPNEGQTEMHVKTADRMPVLL